MGCRLSSSKGGGEAGWYAYGQVGFSGAWNADGGSPRFISGNEFSVVQVASVTVAFKICLRVWILSRYRRAPIPESSLHQFP